MKTISLVIIVLFLSGGYAQKFPKPKYTFSRGFIHRTPPASIEEIYLNEDNFLKLNDKVFVLTRDGQMLRFKVKRIGLGRIGGRRKYVSYVNIEGIRIKRSSQIKTVGLVLTIPLAILLLSTFEYVITYP